MNLKRWTVLYLSLMLLALPVAEVGAAGEQVRFEKIVIDADSKGEAAGVMDVNRSGHLSVVCGESWYEPTDKSLRQWQKHPLRKIEYKLEYFDDFANLVLDVNGDGYPDIISGGFFSAKMFWYENPGKAGGEWKEHLIDGRFIETARLWDVAGDGQPALVPNTPGGTMAWYELKRDVSGKGLGEFIKHTAYDKPFMGEGVGFGDLNGDGRGDFVTSMGWVEAPADRRTGQWIVHEEFKLPGHVGIPMLVHDVNGDGAADIIYGMGHDYGLFWLEQKRSPDGTRQWLHHTIDLRWSQAHALDLADLDGDGRPELIAGKRYRAHGDSDPGGKDPCCLYYYTFDKNGKFTRHTIDEGNTVGVGVDVLITDFNGDGRPDLVCPGKGGLYLFLNQGVGAVAAKPSVSDEEAKLIAILKSSATFAEKSAACRELARVGTAESVPVLSELLEDPQLSHMARYALEGIPGGASEAALRYALKTVKGPLLVGVISSVMARGERWAWPELTGLIRDPDPQVAKAAAMAAGRLAYPLPIKIMQDTVKRTKGPAPPAMVAGLFAAADTLRERRQWKGAIEIYDVLRAAELAPHQRVVAWRGTILSGGADAPRLLLETLRNADPSAFQAALRAADEMPDAKVTRALGEELGKLSAERQVPICKLLGRRGNPATVPVLLPLATAGEKPVRLAAIGAVGQLGQASAIAPLFGLLNDQDAEIADAALGALAGLPEAQVNERVLQNLATPNTTKKELLIRLVGERHLAEAMPVLLQSLGDADPAVRKAAIKSYGEFAGMNELPRVLELLNTTTDTQEIQIVEKVLNAICAEASDSDAVVTRLAAAMPMANAATKAVLLRALGVVGNGAALEVVRGMTGSADKDERLEAIRVLSSWKSADAAPLLLEIAKTADHPTAKLVSLRGYIWMAGRSTLTREQRSEICRTAGPLVDRTDLRRILLSVMATLPDASLFEVMLPILDDPSVRGESLATMTKLVAWTGKRQVPLARAALEKLLKVAADDPATVKPAQELLDKINAIK